MDTLKSKISKVASVSRLRNFERQVQYAKVETSRIDKLNSELSVRKKKEMINSLDDSASNTVSRSSVDPVLMSYQSRYMNQLDRELLVLENEASKKSDIYNKQVAKLKNIVSLRKAANNTKIKLNKLKLKVEYKKEIDDILREKSLPTEDGL